MKIYYITLLLLFCALGTYAQGDIEVTGVVKDINNMPIPGVTVVVKDRAGLGTITTETGRYKIKTGTYSTLIFSYIGYEKKEVQVAGKEVIFVTLKESQANSSPSPVHVLISNSCSPNSQIVLNNPLILLEGKLHLLVRKGGAFAHTRTGLPAMF